MVHSVPYGTARFSAAIFILHEITGFSYILPLRIPICAFDAKTGILCAKCQAKLTAGQITEADIQVSRALVKLAEKIPDVNKMTLLRSFQVEGNYVLEVEQADAAIVRSKPEIKQKLEEQLKGKVWVIAASNSDRRFLEDLFYPIRLLTVNTVWLPDGSKLTKARSDPQALSPSFNDGVIRFPLTISCTNPSRASSPRHRRRIRPASAQGSTSPRPSK